MPAMITRVAKIRQAKSAMMFYKTISTQSAAVPAIRTGTSAFPLSVLSNGVLFRSLVINAVSSTPWLLTPAISFLSFLCQPGRPFLFDVNRNKVLAFIMRQTVYRQFCGGETPNETKATMRKMKRLGFRGTIITLATETLYDYEKNLVHALGIANGYAVDANICPAIEAWRRRTIGAVELLGEDDQLAIKLTGAGSLVTDSLAAREPLPKQMVDALDEISSMCKARRARILIDAESQLYQFGILDVGLDLMKKHNQDGYAIIFSTYQAYLKSTLSTVTEHLGIAAEGDFTFGLKIVRGAYIDTDKRSLIHDTKQDTDDTYDTLALGALRQELGGFGGKHGRKFPSLNLLLASHNKKSVLAAHELHQHRLQEGLPTVPVGYAQLQGMCDELSFGLLQMQGTGKGCLPEVFKCTTWGGLAECLGYLARRAGENRDAASRTQDEFLALRKETWRRLKRVFAFGG